MPLSLSDSFPVSLISLSLSLSINLKKKTDHIWKSLFGIGHRSKDFTTPPPLPRQARELGVCPDSKQDLMNE